jgi:hypothetical protein
MVLARFLFKQMMQVSTFLVPSWKGDGDFTTRADLAVIRHLRVCPTGIPKVDSRRLLPF